MKTYYVVMRSKGQAWEVGKPLSAQQLWSDHATFMNRLAEQGFIILGGPFAEEGGSLLIIDAPDEETTRSTLAEDPWIQAGVLVESSIRPWPILLQAGEEVQ